MYIPRKCYCLDDTREVHLAHIVLEICLHYIWVCDKLENAARYHIYFEPENQHCD